MNKKILEGSLNAKNKKFAIVVSRFNDFITDSLLKGALDCLDRNGVDNNDITIIKVPGAFEIPLISKKIANQRKYDAIICLGTVIRGDTPHFDYICSEVTKGISYISLEKEVPVIFGILTTDTVEQAIERCGTKLGNKGWNSAMNAIEMADLILKLN